MELRALFLLPLCFPGLHGQAPEAQRRREGDTLHIQCPYAASTTGQQIKYWCLSRGNRGNQEVLYVRSYEETKQSQDGRIKIKDNKANKTVSVTMTGLKAEDSGTYFCAAYYSCSYGYEKLKTISLMVFRELLQWELDTLTVQCPEGSDAWCRGQTDCKVVVSRQTFSKQSKMKSLQDRASMEHNAQGALVTMRNLQIRDSGVYWCALDSKRTRKMEVVLSVFKRTQRLTAKESGNITVKCHYKIADYSTVTKAWCKREEGKTCNMLVTTRPESPAANSTAQEGVRIQDDIQQGIVTITMEQLQVQDSGVYWCALQDGSGLLCMEEITLNVSKALRRGGFPDSENQETLLGDSCSGNTFLILSVVLLFLLLLALLTSTALAVRYYRLLLRTGIREAEDTSDRAEGTAQPGRTGRRESSQDGSKGPAYINLDVQSRASPEDPLYCNVEPSQAPRNPQHVEYAIIAFNQSPRTSRE
ncbi:polymeric immunoglobulin receptor-like [Molothrus aeneus]|uniref:polymeric immunoglobulin receptor-like n=1 Tax=Molothrus aeneus TaxID=84833 RepID=UPI00345B484E